ncbi:MAG: serine O-acetyltransferase EpsC [Gemmataceae bacterium]
MATDIRLKDELREITEALVDTYESCGRTHHLGHSPLPSREAVQEILDDLTDILYPGFARRQNLHHGNVEYYVGSLVDGLHDKLTVQVTRALRHELGEESPHVDFEALAQQKVMAFLRRLPELRGILEEDVHAAVEGDPAARGPIEVVFCYPGIAAISTYRLAHELAATGVPLIPRMMTEVAHSKTGIDIHPGATIGTGFFIDHGTGVVIGETCVIGRNVKLYQGVTLGALSFPRDAEGQIIRGKKRHPTLEDDVVIYANATILGGDTIIGRGSVIGSNVWLTNSVPPSTQVVIEKPSLRVRTGEDPGTLMFHI